MRLRFAGLIAAAAAFALIPAIVSSAPQRPPHYVHPAAPTHVTVNHNPVPHMAPDVFHPATRPVVEYVPKVQRDVVVHDNTVYRDITNYHINIYHTTVNIDYASRPGSDGGYWQNGWYHGYWHDYWSQQPWINWSNHYGFWLDLDGMNVFVYEYSPGVCWYWNGSSWQPWYNPPYTLYECPY
jgi:hypothetical protein